MRALRSSWGSGPVGSPCRSVSAGFRFLGIDEYDVGTQILYSHHYWFRGDQVHTHSAPPYRYVWPSELDLMARLAGMSLLERWSSWKREPFTRDSTSHISVWQKNPEGVTR